MARAWLQGVALSLAQRESWDTCMTSPTSIALCKRDFALQILYITETLRILSV